MYRKYPCIDKYPPGKEFITQKQLARSSKLKAAFKVASLWNPKTFPILHVGFMDGTDKQKKWVEQVITTHLQPLMKNIQFVWNTPPNESEIRVSFALKDQAWSLVGKDALDIPKNEPTMNLGWVDNDEEYDDEHYKNTGQVVMHEFGHAIGMIHEHQNPKANPIIWNEDVVYKELRRTNGWDREQVNTNMFKKYGSFLKCEQAKKEHSPNVLDYCKEELVNGSDYDVYSIMHYFYPMSWIKSGPKSIPMNTTYSEQDKKWIEKYYSTVEHFTIHSFRFSCILLVLLFFIFFYFFF